MDRDVMAMRSLGRKVRRSMGRTDSSSTVTRRVGTVTKVEGGRVSVNFGNDSNPLTVEGLRMVKSCADVKAGDAVLVDTVSHVSTFTAILA